MVAWTLYIIYKQHMNEEYQENITREAQMEERREEVGDTPGRMRACLSGGECAEEEESWDILFPGIILMKTCDDIC